MLKSFHGSNRAFLSLICLLLVAAGVQTYWILGMRSEILKLTKQNESNNETVPTVTDTKKNKESVTTEEAQNTKDSSTSFKLTHPRFDKWFDGTRDPHIRNSMREFEQLEKEIGDLFESSLGHNRSKDIFDDFESPSKFNPSIDLQEESNRFVVHVDLPGVSEGDIEVKLDGQKLTISGKREDQISQKDDQGNIIRNERRTGSFSRTITLPVPVKSNGIKSNYTDGVLEISIPKKVTDDEG